jgi:hypothetical protein
VDFCVASEFSNSFPNLNGESLKRVRGSLNSDNGPHVSQC